MSKISEMAREAGLGSLLGDPVFTNWNAEIERFAALVAKAERERFHSIVSAPHWKQAVRAELVKRSGAIRAPGSGTESDTQKKAG